MFQLGAVEGQYFIKYHRNVQLSAQELVDCGKPYQMNECIGGWMYQAFAYIKDNGITRMEDYPYLAKKGKCHNSSIAKIELTLTGYTKVNESEVALQQAVGKYQTIV